MKRLTKMILTAATFALLLFNIAAQGILPIPPVLGTITDVIANHFANKLDKGQEWVNKIQEGLAMFIKARKVGLQVPRDDAILIAKLQKICQQDSETYGLNGQLDKDQAPVDLRMQPFNKPSISKFPTGGNSVDMCTDILRALK